MSGHATAFDALMSAARAAAQCKSKPSRPPAKETERNEAFRFETCSEKYWREKAVMNSVVGRENPKSGDGGISPTFSETEPRDEAESASDCIRAVTEEPPVRARTLAVEEEPAAKRARALCWCILRDLWNQLAHTLEVVEDRRAELKRKIGNLKNRPGDFDPRSVEEEEKVPFLFLALAFDLISNESGRIVITHILCNMLRTILRTTPDDLVATGYLSANRAAAAHEGVLAEAYGGNRAQIKKQFEEKGDLGLVAKGSQSTQRVMYKPPPLTIDKVFNTFRNIAKESWKDSQEKKKNHIKSLLVAATDCEPQYLICLLQAKMRIGYAEQTLLAALGQAAVYTENHSKPPPHINAPLEEAAKIVKQVYSVLPVYEKVITSILTDGLWNLTMTYTLSTRARKDVTLTDIKVDVCIYAFDILYCNGQSLIKEQLNFEGRYDILLYDSFEQESGYFQFDSSIRSNDLEDKQNFLDDALDYSCEGLIVKRVSSDATYEPSRRSNNWLKLKKDYIDKVGDSLDLVPIGAFYGRGKRSGVYGGFLIACYDPDSEEFQSICKISRGITFVSLW
uniref:ATP-dependent DNA ligase family profile domain-containing protein n=1 Tax=Kalanchoe fedtschenkoi TaxID=63787 RepID=A0A7N0RCW6_KALFE